MDTAIGVIVALVIYLLPLAVALHRKHRSAAAIGFVNILLGWTVLGWLWAMIWSLTGNVHPPQEQRSANAGGVGPSGERLQ